MPIYEFRCADCHEVFDALCRTSDTGDAACPACGSISLRKLISTFAVSRSLTPCGTPASETSGQCATRARADGCASCGLDR